MCWVMTRDEISLRCAGRSSPHSPLIRREGGGRWPLPGDGELSTDLSTQRKPSPHSGLNCDSLCSRPAGNELHQEMSRQLRPGCSVSIASFLLLC